jgi:nitrogen-specific signal transduction histidine kinase
VDAPGRTQDGGAGAATDAGGAVTTILVNQIPHGRNTLEEAHAEAELQTEIAGKLRAQLAEIRESAQLLHRLFVTGDSATVAELITQAANEIQRLRGMTVRAPSERDMDKIRKG